MNSKQGINKTKQTWRSLDESKATVSADGKVTAVAEGVVLINVEYEGVTETIYVRMN